MTAGMVGLAPKWVRLAPNGRNPGLFQIRFQYIWLIPGTDKWSLPAVTKLSSFTTTRWHRCDNSPCPVASLWLISPPHCGDCSTAETISQSESNLDYPWGGAGPSKAVSLSLCLTSRHRQWRVVVNTGYDFITQWVMSSPGTAGCFINTSTQNTKFTQNRRVNKRYHGNWCKTTWRTSWV